MPTDWRGRPVGWASMNHRGHWSIGYRAVAAWRADAYKAYERARLPKGLDHVYVEVELRFADRVHRDPANFEPTIKAVIDALQPTTSKISNGKLVVSLGWGVIPGDDPRYLTRGPEQPIGEPLGRKNPVQGLITITITPGHGPTA